jgi:hypothetical protein
MAVSLDGLALAVEPEDLAPPFRRTDEPQKQTDGGRLAGSVRTQVADHLALGDLEVEVVEGGDLAVALGETLRSYGRDAHLVTTSSSVILYINMANYLYV